MRQLITVEYIDNTNYSDNTTNDVVGLVMPHTWGPVNQVTRVDYENFIRAYPPLATEAYAYADSCYNAGCQTMEIVRPQGNATYWSAILYKAKASETDQLNADAYLRAFADIEGTGYETWAELMATIAEAKVAKLNKLQGLQLAIEAYKQDPTPVNKAAFIAALEAALDVTLEDLPSATDVNDWVSEDGFVPANAAAVDIYLSEIIESIATITFVEAGNAVIKLAFDRHATAKWITPSGNPGMIDPADVDTVLAVFTQGYPGNMPLKGDLTIRVGIDKDEDKNRVITFTLIQSLKGVKTVLESHVGGIVQNTILDGRQYFISDVMDRDSEYFDATLKVSADQFEEIVSADPLIVEAGSYLQAIQYSIQEIDDISEDEIIAAYAKFFGSNVTSRASLLIPTKCTQNINNTVKAAAGKREDCCAIIGYPIDQDFKLENIKNFLALMLGQKFAFFYAGRDVYRISGVDVITSCVGVIAGRYCAVAMDATINQVPSAEAWGAYPGSLIETLSDEEVLALHALGGNSVYVAANGPQIWGVKSLHSRQNSYFAKANVMRVIAQLLFTTFPLCNANLHTPNTDRKKAAIQLNRQAYLDQLIAQDVLRAQSTCTCNRTNNRDVDTNGGELLIIDFDLWFVKLIERFKIRITASDDTTTVTGI